MLQNFDPQVALYIYVALAVVFVLLLGVLLYRRSRGGKEKPAEAQVKALAENKETPLKELLAEAKKLEAKKMPEPELVLVEKEVDLKSALTKTEENIFGRIKSLFSANAESSNLEEIEEVLYTSDLGPQTVQKLMEALEDLNRKEKADLTKVRQTLKHEMEEVFSKLPDNSLKFVSEGPTVIMVVGVNGAGKTTSIGKLSAQFAQQGKKVLVAAGDTFRAAAGGQLKVWTDRAQVEIFSPDGVTDPSAVAYDAVAKAKGQGYDVVIIDTAGRLHTQANLMEELKKMKRVMTKVIPDAPHEVIIVLDANSGQNALIQAKEYNNALTLTGAILTKMDGTAKGGVAVGLANELKIPIKFIGVGERIQDLRAFSSQEFVESIFS